MHTLFECPEDVNEITKNHTKAIFGKFCVISLFLQNWFLGLRDVLIDVVWNYIIFSTNLIAYQSTFVYLYPMERQVCIAFIYYQKIYIQ